MLDHTLYLIIRSLTLRLTIYELSFSFVYETRGYLPYVSRSLHTPHTPRKVRDSRRVSFRTLPSTLVAHYGFISTSDPISTLFTSTIDKD